MTFPSLEYFNENSGSLLLGGSVTEGSDLRNMTVSSQEVSFEAKLPSTYEKHLFYEYNDKPTRFRGVHNLLLDRVFTKDSSNVSDLSYSEPYRKL